MTNPVQLPLFNEEEMIECDESLSPEEKERQRILAEIRAEQENPLVPPTITKYREQLVFPAADESNQTEDEE